MNCHEVQDLLHGYLDDELDMVNSLAIEWHLQNGRSAREHLPRYLRYSKTKRRTMTPAP